jgi:hypothetical protein
MDDHGPCFSNGEVGFYCLHGQGGVGGFGLRLSEETHHCMGVPLSGAFKAKRQEFPFSFPQF